MGFVGNYAPCGLSPQMYDMPVIHARACHDLSWQALLLCENARFVYRAKGYYTSPITPIFSNYFDTFRLLRNFHVEIFQ
ncbi:hypothetical protein Poras_0793 [Porphyromonas asaccharolytica DSM 20707]|uniref:Uncharacterized protein n=1 Tax=Porphyromonas asaccharolytica (strain ATCC 25260 / DSM 20707 / BCRC 10618 / CCUG 7834 / JCM 6326 / LMG 13178 / VPI 4198 / B440) TaxID=879243 RepID=F4KK13_PORAD|nr:hypothetical protein Poras_0793 [Porphyromonas asaccharolytica DSM 20707]